MKVLRVFFAIAACAAPLLLCSCSKMDIPDRQAATESLSQDVDAQSPVEDLSDKDLSDSDLSDSDLSDSDSSPVIPQAATADPAPQKVEERKSSAAARAKGEINFDDLKFDLEKDAAFDDELLTKEIRELDGTKVKLRGYILPSTLFSETNISQFVLVRDNQECCFGPGAALFDCVMVQMVPGKTTDFVTRPVTVEGTFVIDTDTYRYPPGLSPTGATHLAVFRIDGEAVQ